MLDPDDVVPSTEGIYKGIFRYLCERVHKTSSTLKADTSTISQPGRFPLTHRLRFLTVWSRFTVLPLARQNARMVIKSSISCNCQLRIFSRRCRLKILFNKVGREDLYLGILAHILSYHKHRLIAITTRA